MSDPFGSLNNSIGTIVTAGVALGTMGMVRDMVRDTRPQRRRAPERRMPVKRMPQKRAPARTRKSILDDPFGGEW